MKCISCNSEVYIEKFINFTKYLCDSRIYPHDTPCNNVIIYDNSLNRLVYYSVTFNLNNKSYVLKSSRDSKARDNRDYSSLSYNYWGPNFDCSNIVTIKRFMNPNNQFKLQDYIDIADKLFKLNIFS